MSKRCAKHLTFILESLVLQPNLVGKPALWYTEAAGGTGFIHETLKSFSIPTSKATILVDLYGYDGALAMASLEETMPCQVNVSLRGVCVC